MSKYHRDELRFDSSNRLIFKKTYDDQIGWIEYNRHYDNNGNYIMTIRSIDNGTIDKKLKVLVQGTEEKQREYDYINNIIRTRLFNNNFMTYQETYDITNSTIYTMVWNNDMKKYINDGPRYSIFGYRMNKKERSL